MNRLEVEEVRSPLLELARESPLRSLPLTDRDVLARSGPLVRREWARSPTSIEPVPALQGARYTSRAVCSDCGVFLSISSHARRQACNQSTLRGPRQLRACPVSGLERCSSPIGGKRCADGSMDGQQRPKKKRKKTDNPREGWEDGTPPPHRDFKERGVVR